MPFTRSNLLTKDVCVLVTLTLTNPLSVLNNTSIEFQTHLNIHIHAILRRLFIGEKIFLESSLDYFYFPVLFSHVEEWGLMRMS